MSGAGRGRPRKTVRPDEIAALLAVGMPHAEVAEKLSVSVSTLQRRLTELRAQHGPNWGRSLLPAAAGAGAVADLDSGELSVDELQQLARSTLELVMRMAANDPKSAVAAARVALALSPEEKEDEPVHRDRTDLLARVRAATASARGRASESSPSCADGKGPHTGGPIGRIARSQQATQSSSNWS